MSSCWAFPTFIVSDHCDFGDSNKDCSQEKVRRALTLRVYNKQERHEQSDHWHYDHESRISRFKLGNPAKKHVKYRRVHCPYYKPEADHVDAISTCDWQLFLKETKTIFLLFVMMFEVAKCSMKAAKNLTNLWKIYQKKFVKCTHIH